MLKLGDSTRKEHPFERVEGGKNLVSEFFAHGYVYEVWRIPVMGGVKEDNSSLEVPIKQINLKDWTRLVDRSVIETVLNNVNWNKSKAARLLGITRTALIEKCKRYQLTNQEVK